MTDLLGLIMHSAGMFALGVYAVGGPSVRGALNGNFWLVPIALVMAGALMMQSMAGTDCLPGFGAAGRYEDC